MSDHESALRQALVDAGRELFDARLNCGTAGNVSARCGAGLLISPSGVHPERTGVDLYDDLREAAPELLERVIFMTGGAFTDCRATGSVIARPAKAAWSATTPPASTRLA